MEKQYEAYADTGRDYISFIFYSSHRANSKANKEDAKKFYYRRTGRKVKVISTCRSDIE